MDLGALKIELNKFQVSPVEIKMISPKDGYKGEARIYILYFNKAQKVNIADLRTKVTGLFHLRVQFRYFSPKKFGPTQCVRCQGLGHGAEYCHLKHRCVTCAGEHESKFCTARIPVAASSDCPNPKPRASDDNTANYSKCPARQGFTKVPKQSKQPNNRRPPPQMNYVNFPSLTNTNRVNNVWRDPDRPSPWNSTHNNPQINPAWEMQHQMMKSFQEMQTEMIRMMQGMFVEIRELIQSVTKSQAPTIFEP